MERCDSLQPRHNNGGEGLKSLVKCVGYYSVCFNISEHVASVLTRLCCCAGLPVSCGEVTAKARVVTSLQAASNIQV